MSNRLVYQGSAVKDLGNGKVGGHLVLFGSPTETDLFREYFTGQTDFDFPAEGIELKSAVYYEHALDDAMKGRVLGRGTLSIDEVGVWIDAQLELRDEYERAIYGMVKSGKLSWSSGTAAHLVERESVKGSTWIRRWPLGIDASLTPDPVDPRTSAVPIKSISNRWDAVKALAAQAKSENLLGPWLEPQTACNALEQVWYALSGRVSDLLLGCCVEEEQTPAEKVSMLESLRVLGAMILAHPEPDGDEAKSLAARVRGLLGGKPGTPDALKAGRVLSQSNHDRLRTIHEGVSTHMASLKDLLAATADTSDESGDEDGAKALRMRRQVLANQTAINALEIGDQG